MSEISNQLENLSFKAQQLADQANQLASNVVESSGGHSDFIVFGITEQPFAHSARPWLPFLSIRFEPR